MQLVLRTCTVSCSAALRPAKARIAIVGSRICAPVMLAYARQLAAEVVNAGGVVISGGAVGADTAAHEGAIAAGGPTWVLAPSGRDRPYPRENARLFEAIASGAHPGSAMLWRFPPNEPPKMGNFHMRNDVIVELCDALVVVQAKDKESGAYKTAGKALAARKPVWVVPPPPWLENAGGSLVLAERPGVRVLWQSRELLASTKLIDPEPIPRREDPLEQSILDALVVPLHREQLLRKANVRVPQLSIALLELELEGLIVERMDGRFERA